MPKLGHIASKKIICRGGGRARYEAHHLSYRATTSRLRRIPDGQKPSGTSPIPSGI